MLSKNLRKIIDDKGLRINWVADKVGVSRSRMSAYMTGRKNPSLPVLRMIAVVLGVTEQDLVHSEDSKDKAV